MNVSDLTLYDSLAGTLQTQQANIDTLDQELSSGLQLQKPSDDPIAVVNALSDQSQVSQLAATTNAANTANAWLGLGNDTANSVIDTLQTVRTLMVQSLSSGTQSSSTYTQIANQVQGAFQQLLGLANTTYGGQSIFAGTAAGVPAYSSTGSYQGNEYSFTVQVGPGQPIAASVPGTTLFGGGSTGVQNLFTTLQNFMTHLAAGPGGTTETNLQNDLTALDANISQAETAATTLGESSQAVQTASTAATDESTQVQTNLASTEDVNVATASTQLQADLASYQAALYAVGQAVPESLASFLH